MSAPSSLESLSRAFGIRFQIALDRTDTLAFALFEADPEVRAFVAHRGEGKRQDITTLRAWRRNEFGKRAYWWDFARRTLDVLPRHLFAEQLLAEDCLASGASLTIAPPARARDPEPAARASSTSRRPLYIAPPDFFSVKKF